mmetsp:Transcript_14753/g.26113  ORF Transcript_14753/g.26113 Transcript_14753/m.26113 type:complete len:91 (+) Transcript_14753:1745-2017(+)
MVANIPEEEEEEEEDIFSCIDPMKRIIDFIFFKRTIYYNARCMDLIARGMGVSNLRTVSAYRWRRVKTTGSRRDSNPEIKGKKEVVRLNY